MSAVAVPSGAMGAALWRAGRIAWKLDPHQREVYELFLAWNERRHTPEYSAMVRATGATLDDVWCEEIARRFGKTAKWILTLTSIAQRRPGAVLTYGTAFAKDIGEIIVPLAEMLHADAPDDVRPRYRRSMGASHEGLYYPNGSIVRLVGVDVNPNGLRGRYSDGVVLSECGFMRQLENLVRAVLLPQFQRRPWAFLALETSTPEEVDHDFSRVFVPDCKARNAYVMRTLDDNRVMSAEEREKYIRQAGGRGHPTCEREYYCIVSRDPERTVIPEFDRKRHVVPRRPSPAHAHCYTAADPAIQDMFALGFARWDAERQKLVVQRSWAERNAGTKHVASVIRATEAELWSGTTAWSHETKTLNPQPHARVSDTDLRLIYDLSNDYGIFFAPTLKDDKDAQIYALRDAFLNDLIEIEEDSGPLADHLEAARWNERRTDFERTAIHGHFDCVAEGALVKTSRGDVPIEHVVAGDLVWTRRGLRVVLRSWLVGERETWALESDAGRLEATADHRVWTDSGWKTVESLTTSDMLCGWESSAEERRAFLQAGPMAVTPMPLQGSTECILRPGQDDTCIATFGRLHTGPCREALTCITETATRSTTTWATSSCYPEQSIAGSTEWSVPQNCEPGCRRSMRPLLSGTDRRTGVSFTRNSESVRAGVDFRVSMSASASAAESGSQQSSRDRRRVAHGATRSLGEVLGSTTSRLNAPSVDKRSSEIATQSPVVARCAVHSCGATGRRSRVYDLMVDGEHEFFANGVLVHNCLDMLIYLWRYVSGMRNLRAEPPKSHAFDYFERPKHEPTMAERLQPDWRRGR